MDVTCPRCATEYEFDETLVSDRGTTVKCTNCGHLFKVYPPGARPNEGERAWMVRRRDGTEQRLGSLRDLQQRITRGELEVDDEISRSGEAWKRLGDIAELQTFFRAAEAARAPADATEADPRKQTLFGVGAAPSVPAPPPPPRAEPPRAAPPRPTPPRPAPAATPPPRPAPASTPPRPAAAATAAPSPPAAPASAPPASARGAVAPPPRPPGAGERSTARPPASAPAARAATRPAPAADVDAAAATVAARPRPPAAPDAADTAPAARPRKPLYLDDADERPPVQGAKRSRAGLWVVLGLLVIGGGAAAAYRFLPMASGADPVAEFLRRGDEALAQDTVEGYEDAIREYLRASAHDERDPRVLAALAQTYAAWAQALELRASDLEARASADPALRGEAASLRRERDRRAQEAREQAETLLRLHPGDPRAELAMAEALRLSGDASDAQGHLDRARAMFEAPPATFHLADALLAMARGETAQAAEAAEAAIAADGRLLRARLLLARLRLAQGDVAGARAQIQAVLAQIADHPEARHLADAIDQGLPPAAPVVEVPDAGVDAAAPSPQTSTAPSAAGTTEGSEEPSATSARGHADRGGERAGERGGPAPRGRDYSWYIRRGDALLDSGDLEGARAHYELAEEQRPGSVEALTGLGQVALRQGNLAEAARRFRPAARADYGDAYIGLAETYRRLGRTEDAIATYRAYLASRPAGPHANLARRQIEALTPATPPTMEAPESPPNAPPVNGTPRNDTPPNDTPANDTPANAPSSNDGPAAPTNPAPAPPSAPSPAPATMAPEAEGAPAL